MGRPTASPLTLRARLSVVRFRRAAWTRTSSRAGRSRAGRASAPGSAGTASCRHGRPRRAGRGSSRRRGASCCRGIWANPCFPIASHSCWVSVTAASGTTFCASSSRCPWAIALSLSRAAARRFAGLGGWLLSPGRASPPTRRPKPGGCEAGVESGAGGVAVVQINADTNQITYRVVAFNLPAPISGPTTGAHIHVQNLGSATGGIVVDFERTGLNTGLVAAGTTTAPDADAILANPQNYYVNLHTTECPSGTIRGQLA
jgi:hypothetical protein